MTLIIKKNPGHVSMHNSFSQPQPHSKVFMWLLPSSNFWQWNSAPGLLSYIEAATLAPLHPS